jgi:RIO kinase 1
VSSYHEFDVEDNTESIDESFIKIKTRRALAAASKKGKKSSFERNSEVQRWLKEQATEDSGMRPEFNPTFLASQRDAPWILSSLTQFYEEDLITDVLHTVKSGKEASVYCCKAHPRTGMDYLAAKIYRPRMFRSLRNDAIYRDSREHHDADGQMLRGTRSTKAYMRKNEAGRLVQVSQWIAYEYATQEILYAHGARVPKPFSQIGNSLLMEYIGALNDPAPLLREIRLTPEEAPVLFNDVLQNIELALVCHRIHGDLSEYNILYWQGSAVLIDFAQAVDPKMNAAGVFPLLLRDIERVYQYFAHYGVEANPSLLAADMWTRYLQGML